MQGLHALLRLRKVDLQALHALLPLRDMGLQALQAFLPPRKTGSQGLQGLLPLQQGFRGKLQARPRAGGASDDTRWTAPVGLV